MAEKYQGKYRVSSSRLPDWDYGTNAAYFITICVKEHISCLGEISGSEMNVNSLGQIARKRWQEIPQKFPFVELSEFVIMPNHLHGILIIDKADVETRFIASPPPPDQNPKENKGGITSKTNPMLQENISRIIRWFKGRTTFEIRKLQPDFA